MCLSCSAATEVIKTIQASGGDYTTLSAWEAGRQTNCVTADSIEIGQIKGSWSSADTTAITISGWTTDATRYIVVTNSTSKHDGKRYGSAANAYSLEIADANALALNEEFVRVYGLQINITGMTADRIGILINSVGTSYMILAYNILTGASVANGAALTAIAVLDSDVTVDIYNCIVHDGESQDNVDGISYYVLNATAAKFYNCTAFHGYQHFRRAGGNAYAYNCLSQNPGLSTGDWVGTWAGGDYNCAYNNDADTPGANSVKNYNATFVSETAPLDLHLAAASTSIIDVTTDQSSGLFADDIDYVTRSGAWDIGADEYVAPASGGLIMKPTSIIH